MYGIIYLWYDRKHKRFYLGSHWGTEDDGYICSSTHMKRAYKRRPRDFKRRILKRIYTDRKSLLDEEYRFLQMIKPEELKTRYYNIKNTKFNHWSAIDIEQAKLNISQKTKEAMQRPEVREKFMSSLETRNCRSNEPEVREKRRQSMLKTMEQKFPKENRYTPPKFGSEEYIENMRKSCIESWNNRPVEKLEERNRKISESLQKSKEYRSQLISQMKWWNNGVQRKRSVNCPGPEWKQGRTL